MSEGARLHPPGRFTHEAGPFFQRWTDDYFNTIHANDFRFYEELNTVIQEEPANSADPEIRHWHRERQALRARIRVTD
jgi:hypothetical protein